MRKVLARFRDHVGRALREDDRLILVGRVAMMDERPNGRGIGSIVVSADGVVVNAVGARIDETLPPIPAGRHIVRIFGAGCRRVRVGAVIVEVFSDVRGAIAGPL
jgi:hypothetical protein